MQSNTVRGKANGHAAKLSTDICRPTTVDAVFSAVPKLQMALVRANPVQQNIGVLLKKNNTANPPSMPMPQTPPSEFNSMRSNTVGGKEISCVAERPKSVQRRTIDANSNDLDMDGLFAQIRAGVQLRRIDPPAPKPTPNNDLLYAVLQKIEQHNRSSDKSEGDNDMNWKN